MRKNMNRLSLKIGSLFLIISLAWTIPLPARTIYLSPEGNDSSAVKPGAVFRTLQRAAECLIPGDTLIVRKGIYAGGVQIKVKATAGSPVLIRGESLEAVIEGSAPGMPDAIRIQDAAYVTIDRLSVRKAARAGCGVRFSNHITITNSRFGDNGVWGIFTSFADDIRFEGNECFGSKKEHGIYHSNSGDRFIIRGNLVHDNNGNGIHMNGDPEIPGGDGILNWGLVEKNVIYGNGAAGGASINMTHVHDLIVRNNLCYNNLAGGITVYQDTGTFEQGSKRVLIMGNTVFYQPGKGRSGVNVQTTSEKVVIAGNIFVSGGQRGNIQVNSDHLGSVVTDRNILWGAPPDSVIERKDSTMSLEAWRRLSGNDIHTVVADPLFTDPSTGDFGLRELSPAVDAGMQLDSVRAVLIRLGGFDWILARLDSLPQEDNRGNPRPAGKAPAAGALERAR
jgi:parallel beta-helix repeat protein